MPGFLRDPRTRGVAEASERLERAPPPNGTAAERKIARSAWGTRARACSGNSRRSTSRRKRHRSFTVCLALTRDARARNSQTRDSVSRTHRTAGRTTAGSCLRRSRRRDRSSRRSRSTSQSRREKNHSQRKARKAREPPGTPATRRMLFFFLGERRRGTCRPLGEHMGRSLSRGPRGGPDDEKKKKSRAKKRAGNGEDAVGAFVGSVFFGSVRRSRRGDLGGSLPPPPRRDASVSIAPKDERSRRGSSRNAAPHLLDEFPGEPSVSLDLTRLGLADQTAAEGPAKDPEDPATGRESALVRHARRRRRRRR